MAKETKIKMVASDTIHISSVQAEPILKDADFEVAEAEAKELEDRGLAKRAKSKAK